jgi:serine/threonine-protein kinase
MAEILLGRVVGPMGFERPVVIKQILPHLARDPKFVEMFMDEARIAARIRHPNVVQVQELAEQEDGELFIVMEYLEGESLSNLVRRLTRLERRVPPALCAHIIAEAAAGLQAAHDLTDEAGNPVELVHRDVSPPNLFVTYDGTVKVLDFGIAKGNDRGSRTETGQLKGKFEYMSPEQCAGRPLDRRSDIFSLGTVLWEMATGRRLFRRKNQLLTLRAILEAKLDAPSTYAPDFPEELDRIVCKALSRRRSERYQTAAELRRDLLLVARAGELMPDEALRDLMVELFADRVDEKREMLARLKSGNDISHVPAPEVDQGVELPEVDEAAHEIDLTIDGSLQTVAAKRARPRKRFYAGLVVAAAVVAGASAWIALALQSDEGAARSSLDPSEVTAPAPAGLAGPAAVTVTIESEPPGATVLRHGAALGRTPLDVELERGTIPLELVLEREGFRSERIELVPDVAQRFRLDLARERIRRRAPPARGPDRAETGEPGGPEPSSAMYHRFD